jgi:putative MATE family efflux protein
VTDIFFVSRLGPDAVAAVGLTEATVTIFYALAIGLSMGATAMVSRRIGEKDADAAATVAAQALWLGLVVSVIIGVIGIAFGPDILRLMGASEAVIRDGGGYTQVMLGGSITIMYLFLINAIFRGAGDASIAMRSLWIANGINIVLDPILIFGLGPFPEMGVTGAAVATTIGRGIGVGYQLYYLFGANGRIQVLSRHLSIVTQVMRRLVQVSLGGVMQFLITTSSWILLVRIISNYGSEAVAGYTIGIRVIIFTILPAWGLSNAAATLVGQNLGAKRPERAVRSVWRAAQFNLLFLTCVGIVFITLAEPILRLFTDNPEVIAYGRECLRWISYGYPVYGIGMVVIQAINGAGDTGTPTRINLLCYWMFQIPLAYWLAESIAMGASGTFVAIFVAETVMTIMAVWVFKRGQWKLKQV